MGSGVVHPCEEAGGVQGQSGSIRGQPVPPGGLWWLPPGAGHAQSEMKCTILLTVFQNAIKGSEHAPTWVLAAGRGVK